MSTATTEREIVCPPWCAVTQEQHRRCSAGGTTFVHLSRADVDEADGPAASLELCTEADGTATCGETYEVCVNDACNDGLMSIDQAEAYLDDLAAAIENYHQIHGTKPYAERRLDRIHEVIVGTDVWRVPHRYVYVLSSRTGIALERLLRCLTGKAPFDANEMQLMANALGVTVADLLPQQTAEVQA